MDFLPLFLRVRNQTCVVVGGGVVALRKIRLLLQADARVCVIAPQVHGEIREALSAKNGHQIIEQEFTEDLLEHAQLLIAATENLSLNRELSEIAGRRNIPINVVDQPQLCSFIMPAIVNRDPVLIALSSSGTSPVLLRQLKEMLEVEIPASVGALAKFLGSKRANVKESILAFEERLQFWEQVLESEIPELVYGGEIQRAENCFADALRRAAESHAMSSSPVGEVYLVGAGPGDPDLLTLKALRLMHKADVVLYDRLVSDAIMARIRPDADRIHVGKEQANHSVPQESINHLLVHYAKLGKRVLRLKGGDPFIFGRGGEEIETLAQESIPFQVVPGITAASGCAAYAGIPLTHRDHSQSVRFLTGHLKDGSSDLDWPTLAKEQQTLVFYMGLTGLSHICACLIEYGMSSVTPVALIQKGTTPQQRVISGTLASIVELVAAEQIQAPTLIIVGEVVKLRNRLSWFQSQTESI